MKNINIFKAAYDRIYGIENLISFTSPYSGYSKIELSNSQKEVIDAIDSNNHIFIRKFRQYGITTTVLAYLTLEALYKEKSCIIIHTSKLSYLQYHIRIIRDSLIELSTVYNLDLIKKYSKDKIELNNGSIFLFTSNHFCSYRPTHIFIDEYLTKDFRAEYYQDAKIITTYTFDSPEIDQLSSSLRNVVHLKTVWYRDSRFNKGLYWLSNNGFKLYNEIHYTKESIDEALLSGLTPMSKWLEEKINMFGNKIVKDSIDI